MNNLDCRLEEHDDEGNRLTGRTKVIRAMTERGALDREAALLQQYDATLKHVGLLLGLVALVAAGCSPSVPTPRHLLLISVDTLRADHLGCYGHTLDLTPNIDRLATESERFAYAYAATPFTLPSVVAMMTGRHPGGLGMLSNIGRLPQGVLTLAQLLRARGWMTGAVVSNYVLRQASGMNRGFAKYNAIFPQHEEN